MFSQQASSEYEFFWFVIILNVALFVLVVITVSLSYSKRTESEGTSEAYSPLIGVVVPHWAEISVGFILAFMVAGFVNLFAAMPVVILSFIITWIVSSYLVYKYLEHRIWTGGLLLVLGIACLAMPLEFLTIEGQRLGLSMGAMESVALAVVLLPLGIVLMSVGLWLASLGLRRLRIVSAPKSEEGRSQEES